MDILAFQKPSRYIDGEVNAVHKQAAVKVALAFPDIYDVGMSHLGLKILYKVVNEMPSASAERVFSPWLDLDAAMRNKGVLLSSLETGRPLRDFDIVGFSLQYELSYTTVLNMLHLGGLALRTEERLGVRSPLVIAGGPCTLNPWPLSPFIDAFLVGDGEEAVREIIGTYHLWKDGGTDDKAALLQALAGIEGVFVPLFGREKKIVRRILPSLEDAPFPDSPVLPFTSIIHDRVNIEIARGCSMGCRFCQAGMAYRPVRERSVSRVLELAERSLKSTGYENVSFTSLSAGDYSCLPELMREFNRMFSGKRISMSLPSLRVATVTGQMLREIREVRKSGFTMAPEAGTDRLRAVINKDFTDEMYMTALETLFAEGWLNVKLYFMTGLPTETEEDISAIPEMVIRAIKTSKRLTGRHVNISVGVSSFVPKPHTPFQWCGQLDIDLLRERNRYLKNALLRRGVKYKGHNEEMSLLEAVFARGDERLSDVIEKAWSLGCRLDAWTESFDFGKWEEAFEGCRVDARAVAQREYERGSLLPWDNISTGVTREYLWKEYCSALSGAYTPDCRKRCHGCGLKCTPEKKEPGDVRVPTGSSSPGATPLRVGAPKVEGNPAKVRLRYSKTGRARYLSHLELTTALTRAMRRADFPLKYSEGFHPTPRISLGPALSVGVGGLREYLDVELIAPFDLGTLKKGLNDTLPAGIRIDALWVVYRKERSLNEFLTRYLYEIKSESPLVTDGFFGRSEVLVERKGVPVNVRELVESIERVDDRTFRMTVLDRGETKVRLHELLPLIFGVRSEDVEITRIAMFGRDGGWTEPVEGASAWAAKS